MSLMHRRRMVIERAKKMKLEKEGETDGNQGQDQNGQIQEGEQGSQNGGAQGGQESSPQTPVMPQVPFNPSMS